MQEQGKQTESKRKKLIVAHFPLQMYALPSLQNTSIMHFQLPPLHACRLLPLFDIMPSYWLQGVTPKIEEKNL